MQSRLLSFVISALFTLIVPAVALSADTDKELVQGVWIAQSMEANGQPAPAEAVSKMRFTFKGDKVLIRGNHSDDREEEASYTIDATKSPKQIDVTWPKADKPLLGIYALDKDQLKLCMRHGSSSAGRPTEFSSKVESVLIVFKKQADK